MLASLFLLWAQAAQEFSSNNYLPQDQTASALVGAVAGGLLAAILIKKGGLQAA